MADVLVRIASLYESFSLTQKRLADYLLKHGDEVPFLSVHDLARAGRVSVASVSRFARAVGCRDVKDFKTRVGRESLSSYNGIYQSIKPGDGDEEVIEKIFLGNIRSLEDTLKILTRADLIRAARAIGRSKRVVFFGIGTSGNIAQDAALRFSQLGLQAEAYNDSYRMLNQALRTGRNEVAFGISHSGRSVMTVKTLELASKNGATTVGMSNYLKSPLHDRSMIFLCTSFPESRVKVAALSSRVAQMCLIDALYILVARHKRISLSRTERLNTYAEQLFRLPAE